MDKPKHVVLNNLSDLAPSEKPGDILLIDNLPSLNVLTLYVENDIKHVVQKSNFNSKTEIYVSELMMSAPEAFIDFPLSSIFGYTEPNIETENEVAELRIHIEHASQKKQILAQVETYLRKFTNSTSLMTDVLLASDEIITNSIYNAPFVDKDNSKSGPTRDFSKIQIDPDKKACFFVGADTDRIIIGCRDQYGTLNVDKLIGRIKSCYESNPGQVMNFGPGGAGIGSFLIFDSCLSMYIAVDLQRSTTICCSFPVKMSATKRSQIPKNLHVVVRKNERI